MLWWLQRSVANEEDVTVKLLFKNKNLSNTWIDYKKVFHSILHEWLINSLELMKAAFNLIFFLNVRIDKNEIVS